MTNEGKRSTASAFTRVGAWTNAWRVEGAIAILLDFDGTLAPIVPLPDDARLTADARAVVQALSRAPGAYVAVVSGRGLADVRDRVGIEGIAYAGNHGMEIEGPGIHRLHPAAAAARPLLEVVIERSASALSRIEGAALEDKGLTLTVHYRRVARPLVEAVRDVVDRAVAGLEGLRVTEGKEVLEVRPRVDWHKGRAVEFLLRQFEGGPAAPVIYIGDDTTDEDAFEAVGARRGGAGIIVGGHLTTNATAHLESVDEVTRLLDRLLAGAPAGADGSS